MKMNKKYLTHEQWETIPGLQKLLGLGSSFSWGPDGKCWPCHFHIAFKDGENYCNLKKMEVKDGEKPICVENEWLELAQSEVVDLFFRGS